MVKGTRLRGKGVEFGRRGFWLVLCAHACMQPCGFYTRDHHLKKLVVLHSALHSRSYHTADASAVWPREARVVQVIEITRDHATVFTHSGELTFTLYL